jgi:hypothetical protein
MEFPVGNVDERITGRVELDLDRTLFASRD